MTDSVETQRAIKALWRELLDLTFSVEHFTGGRDDWSGNFEVLESYARSLVLVTHHAHRVLEETASTAGVVGDDAVFPWQSLDGR